MKLFHNLLLALIVSSLLLLSPEKGFLSRLQQAAFDFSVHLREPQPYNPRIVIIEVTDAAIAKVGRWPWKRSWHAAMAKTLTGLGAKSIYFDIIFSEASDEQDDALLETAIKSSQNIYLPFVFQDRIHDIENALFPISRFSSYIKGTGTISIYPDTDGTIRKIPLVFASGGKIYPHISLKIAMDYLNMEIGELTYNSLLLSNQKNAIRIPLVEKETMLVNWTGKWQKTFKHYDYLDVLAAYQDLLQHKKPKINLADFKDSVCLVGVTAIGLYDIRAVPGEPEYPGIGIIATTISNILDKKFIFYPPLWIKILLFYLLVLLPAFFMGGEKPVREIGLTFLIAVGYFFISFACVKNGIMLDLSLPLLGLLTSSGSVGTYNFIRISIERQKFFKMAITDGLTGLYNIRYFKLLLENEIRLARPNPASHFVVLMGDIDHFKQFNDTYGHQMGDLVLKEVSNVLKSSVRSSDIVARYGGEEMIVLLRGAQLADGMSVAEKIRRNVESSVIEDPQHNPCKVTMSLGVAGFKPEDDTETLIKRADTGLYHSKEAGRNRVTSVENQ